MNRLALATVLGLTAVGCSHTKPSAQQLQMQEEGKCELVHTLLREPVPARLLTELSTNGREGPVPVTVFVRRPDEGVLERFFAGDTPACGGDTFRAMRQLSQEGLVLYLEETPDGYAYDARRAGPEELSMGGAPQGVVRRGAAGGWVAATD